MATRVFDGINSMNNFWRGPPKEHCCQVWCELAQQFGRRRCLKKYWLRTAHDRHSMILKANLEHVVFRRSKKQLRQVQVNPSNWLSNKVEWPLNILKIIYKCKVSNLVKLRVDFAGSLGFTLFAITLFVWQVTYYKLQLTFGYFLLLTYSFTGSAQVAS